MQTLKIGLIVSLQTILQIIFQIIIIRKFGIGKDSDVYIASQTMPLIISSIITASLQSVWMPRFVKGIDDNKWDKEIEISQGQSAIISFVIILTLALSINFWLPLSNPGFSSSQIRDTKFFSIILLITTAFSNQSSILTIALRSKNKFILAELVTLFSLLISFFLILVIKCNNIFFLILILLTRSILTYLLHMHLSNWPKLSIVKAIKDKQSWILIKPLLIGTSIYKTSPIIDRFWASKGISGSMTSLTLAQTITTSVSSILERSIATPLIPKLSKFVQETNFKKVRIIYKQLLVKIFIIIFISILTIFLIKDEIINLLQMILNTNRSSSKEIINLGLILSGNIFASVTGGALVSVFYAFGDTKTPVFIGTIGFLIGVILKFILFFKFNIIGLAMASSFYLCFNIIFFIYFIEIKLSKLSSYGF